MEFEVELLHKRFDATEDDVWRVINVYCSEFLDERPRSHFGYSDYEISDLRNTTKWVGDYAGIPLEITFPKDGDKLIWFGVTHVGSGRFSRHEHIVGYIEVRRLRISADTPVEVRIACGWRPFYLFFKGMADSLITHFEQQPIDIAFFEIQQFKMLVERQMYVDIFVNGRAQENIARALLQTFLIRRSYREVPVRGGQSDILVFDRQGRFLYETKIWRGIRYFQQGLQAIEEYITGEDSDQQLTGVFYVMFDPTKSAAARRSRGSDFTTEFVANRTVNVVIISLSPPTPSKKGTSSNVVSD